MGFVRGRKRDCTNNLMWLFIAEIVADPLLLCLFLINGTNLSPVELLREIPFGNEVVFGYFGFIYSLSAKNILNSLCQY